jgi:hypothetical protein
MALATLPVETVVDCEVVVRSMPLGGHHSMCSRTARQRSSSTCSTLLTVGDGTWLGDR